MSNGIEIAGDMGRAGPGGGGGRAPAGHSGPRPGAPNQARPGAAPVRPSGTTSTLGPRGASPSPARAVGPGNFHNHFHHGHRRFFGGSWWDWQPWGWSVVVLALGENYCAQWSEPLQVAPDFGSYAAGKLAASSGDPMSERLPDQVLYLYTLEPAVTVRRCVAERAWSGEQWPAFLGEIGDAPPVVLREHPRGMDGVRKGAGEIASKMVAGARNREVIEWARQNADPGPVRGYPNPDSIVRSLFEAWKKRVKFVKDPLNTELIAATSIILCVDKSGECHGAGDCDEQLLLGSALLALGIPVWLRVRSYAGQNQAHVVMLYDSDPKLREVLKCLDPSIESGTCSDAPYLEEIKMEIDMGQYSDSGTFMGIGAPPGQSCTVSSATGIANQIAYGPWRHEFTMPKGHGVRGRSFPADFDVQTPDGPKRITARLLGGAVAGGARMILTCPHTGDQFVFLSDSAAPMLAQAMDNWQRVRDTLGPMQPQGAMGADQVVLPDDQAQAWLAQLASAGASLDRARARLRTNMDALAKVRADFGLPVADPPAGEAVQSNMGYYVTSKQWTAAAQDSETKLLATAGFLSGAVADALAGKRALSWDQGDLRIGTLPSDSYGVQLITDPVTKATALWYVDVQTNSPTGQIGIAPAVIIVGILGIAVVTLAAVYAVAKVSDYMATAHHDDMLQKVADQQQQLVASGKETPAQASQFLHGMTDFAEASRPPSSTPSTPWTTYLYIGLAAVGGLVLGIFGGRMAGGGGPIIIGGGGGRREPEPAVAAFGLEDVGARRRRRPRRVRASLMRAA